MKDKLTYEILDKFLKDLSTPKNKEDFKFMAFCEGQGKIIVYDTTNPLCSNSNCYWCNSLRDEMKKYINNV